MIQARNKMLTIWLLHKVYCRLLTAFVCPLQAVEDDGVGKKIQLLDHRINSSDLPEVVVVTSAGSNPALAELFFILQTFCCTLFIARTHFS